MAGLPRVALAVAPAALAAALALGAGAVTPALVRAAPPPAGPSSLRVEFQRFTLDNGLTVILHEDHRVPTVTVNLLVRVGSKDEPPGRTGFAHLFEHLMFMGTRAVPSGEFDRLMESAGGANNGETSEDATSYFETGPRNLLATFLYLEADRLSSLDLEMTQAKLDAQREVVLNERRQSVEEKPYAQAEVALGEHLFPAPHPYHHPIIGSAADLRAATVADVRAFFRAHYAPGNVQLSIAGDFAPDEARRLVERYFDWIPARPLPPASPPPPPTLARPEVVQLREAVEQAQVTVAMVSPAAFADGEAECQLLAAVLGMGRASRLHRALVQEGGLAQSVEVQQHRARLAGWFTVQALGQEGADVAALEKAIGDELARLVTSPPTEGELSRARALLQTQELRRLERASAMAVELNLYQLYLGDPAELSRRLMARFDEVRVEDLARVARQLVEAPGRLTVRVLPRDEVPSAAAAASLRSSPPSSPPPAPPPPDAGAR